MFQLSDRLHIAGGHPALAAVGDFYLVPGAENVEDFYLGAFVQDEERLALLAGGTLDG